MFGSNSCSMRSPCRCSALYMAPSTASNSRTSWIISGDGTRTRSTMIVIGRLHHAHPEHLPLADIDIVFADVIERAVAADAEHRQAGRYLPDRIIVLHRQAHDV